MDKKIYVVLGLLVLSLFAVVGCTVQEPAVVPQQVATVQNDNLEHVKTTQEPAQELAQDKKEAEYAPVIRPADFTSELTHKYFHLIPGQKFVYEAESEEGLVRVETLVMRDTKMVGGVETTVVWDREFLNGEIVEDTKDWYAQDKEGNVWYFGEESYEIVDGEIVTDAGSWEHGVNNAYAGIIMEANPKKGDEYWQEYYPGEALDKGTIEAVGVQVTLGSAFYADCVQIRDWTPLDLSIKEYKYFCSKSGFLTLDEDLEDGEQMKLVEILYDQDPFQPVSKVRQEKQTDITQAQAEALALQEVPGTVTDISIEKKFGTTCYVIEVDADEGLETDVIIEIATGEVLGVET